MVRARFRLALFLLLLGIPLAACTHHVKLYDPFTYKTGQKEWSPVPQIGSQEPKPISVEKIRIAIRKARDLRPNFTKIGEAGLLEPVELEKGIVLLDFFTDDLIRCFELAGYEVIPIEDVDAASPGDREKVKAWIVPEMMRFWVEFTLSEQALKVLLNIREAESDVMFQVRLYAPEGKREIWSQIFQGKGYASWGFRSQRATLQRSINNAYAEAMRDLYKAISDQKMKNTLLRFNSSVDSPPVKERGE